MNEIELERLGLTVANLPPIRLRWSVRKERNQFEPAMKVYWDLYAGGQHLRTCWSMDVPGMWMTVASLVQDWQFLDRS